MSEIKIKGDHINTSSSVTRNEDGTLTLRIETKQGKGEMQVMELTSNSVRDAVWAIAFHGLKAGAFTKEEL